MMGARTSNVQGISPQALSRVSLFAGLSDNALNEVADLFIAQWLEDREILFHINGPGDCFYVVGEGAIEVLRFSEDESEEVVINTVGAGGTVGELAILRGERRSATVRAKGRTQVFWIDASSFMDLIRRWPEISINAVQFLGNRLIHVEDNLYKNRKTLVWGSALGAALDLDFIRQVMAAAPAYLPEKSPSQRLVLLATGVQSCVRDLGEMELEEIPLPTALDASELSKQIDQAVKGAAIVVAAVPAPLIARMAGRCDVLLFEQDYRELLAPMAGRYIEVAQDGAPSASRVRLDYAQPRASVAGRIARILLGRSTGVALGGGAALGFAHLGVLEVLTHLGVPIDFITGTSMGALVGAFYVANGVSESIRFATNLSRRLDWLKLLDRSFLASGVIRGKKLKRFIRDNLETQTFEDLAIPLAMMAVDLESGEERMLCRGPIPDAIRSSISIPGLLTPFPYKEPNGGGVTTMVDGSIVNNIPVDVVRTMGAHRVIGINVTPRRTARRAHSRSSDRSNSWVRSVSSYLPLISRLDTILRSHHIFIVRAGERQVFTADVALMPNTSEFGFLEFWRAAEIIETGRQVARAQADQLRALTA